MTIIYDEKNGTYIAYAKVNGIPFLAYSTERNEAFRWCIELMQERFGRCAEVRTWIH